MEGKWLIADRDLNEREGLKWLLKGSAIPVTDIYLAASYQEFVLLFERETPDVVLMELDMISREEWSTFRDLLHIYDPIILLTSAEATFERARLAIDLHALDLMVKPFSTTKVKSAYQRAAHNLGKKKNSIGYCQQNLMKDISYESLFLSNGDGNENYILAAYTTEAAESIGILHSFLMDYPFHDLNGVFALNNMVILLFKNHCQTITDQCQKAIRKWEEDFSEPLAIVVHKGNAPLHEKFTQTQKMLQLTYYKGYLHVNEFDRAPDWEHIDPFLDPPEQRTWIEMLANFELDKIKTWLYDEFLNLLQPYPDPGLVRIRLTSILAQIRRFMKTNHLNEQEGIEEEYRYIFHSILYDTVLYRTVQNLILFIQKIFLVAVSGTNKLAQDPIERGITFMEANFSNCHLKLEDVAQYVDRNPSYFSHLLMMKTGKGFSELLSSKRMMEAKRLLRETRKPIKEISNLVGYQNSNYFSKSFKEFIGMTPREYRMNKTVGLTQKDS